VNEFFYLLPPFLRIPITALVRKPLMFVAVISFSRNKTFVYFFWIEITTSFLWTVSHHAAQFSFKRYVAKDRSVWFCAVPSNAGERRAEKKISLMLGCFMMPIREKSCWEKDFLVIHNSLEYFFTCFSKKQKFAQWLKQRLVIFFIITSHFLAYKCLNTL